MTAAAYKTYVVTSEIIGREPNSIEYERLEDAHKVYEEIDLAYDFRTIRRTSGWRATEDMVLAKSLHLCYYDEDDNELDIPYDPVLYEEYSLEDYKRDTEED